MFIDPNEELPRCKWQEAKAKANLAKRRLYDADVRAAERRLEDAKPIAQEAQFEANLNEFDRMLLKGMCISL